MRILHVVEASGSGTLRIVEVLAERQVAAGHDVRVAIGRRPETPSAVGAGLPEGAVVDLGWDRRSLRGQAAAARRLAALADEEEPDVVHLHSTFAGLVGVVALRRHRPLVFTPHCWASTLPGAAPQRALARAGDRLIAARADVVGAVSQAEAGHARALGARRVTVVGNGLPELDEPPRDGPPPPRRPLVVAMGRMAPSRRPVATARLLARLADRADVRWIGGGTAAAEAEVRAAGITVTGWLPRREAVEQLAAAAALVHWSTTDGRSVAVLEAMARDVAVVGSDIAANRELLPGRQLFDDEDGAVALLRQVVTDQEVRHGIIDDQRRRRAGHGATAMAAGWERVYDDLLAPVGRPAGGR